MKNLFIIMAVLIMAMNFSSCGKSNSVGGDVGGSSTSAIVNSALSSEAQTFRQLIIDGGNQYAMIYDYGDFRYVDSKIGSFDRTFDVRNNIFDREDGLTSVQQIKDLLVNIMDTSDECQKINYNQYVFGCRRGNFVYFIDLNMPLEANPASVVEYAEYNSNNYSGNYSYSYVVYQYYIQSGVWDMSGGSSWNWSGSWQWF